MTSAKSLVGRMVRWACVIGMLVTPVALPTATQGAQQRQPAPEPIKLATFNTLKPQTAGRPWSSRRTAAFALIRRLNPDVLALQEAKGFGKNVSDSRPALDIARSLGFEVMKTMVVPGREPQLTSTSQYILYRPTRFTAGRTGEIRLRTTGQRISTPWGQLTDRKTGRALIVLNNHLTPGSTKSGNKMRAQETRRLLKATARLGLGQLPVVHVGDFNSHKGISTDAPARVLSKAGFRNSANIADRASRTRYNSYNGLRRKAAAGARHLDYIWVPPGAKVSRWDQAVNIRANKYVGTFASDHNPVAATVVLPR